MAKVTIPFGPQHPALKEPERFDLTILGERIVRLNARLGYNHRGIEKACEQRSYISALYLIERICGICSHSHATAFVQCVEEIAGLEVPARARYIRTLIAELERMHSHLLWLGVAGHEIGFDTLLMYTWRDREVVMDLLAALTGNRVNYGINTIGGVRRDVSPEQCAEILRGIDTLEERTKYYMQLATEDAMLAERLVGRRGPGGPRLQPQPGCAARRSLRRVRRTRLQGDHRHALRRLWPRAGACRRADGVLPHHLPGAQQPPGGPNRRESATQDPGRGGADPV
jgi:Ni,Fe-hydrogenase III large subunit